MKKLLVMLLCLLMMISGGVEVFAYDGVSAAYDTKMIDDMLADAANNDMDMADLELISLLSAEGGVDTENLTIKKIDQKGVDELINDIDNVNIDKSNIYLVEQKEGNVVEKSILADVVVAASGNSGETTQNGSSSRVVASCVIGYETITQETVKYAKGTYYGGRIVSQPNSSVISSIKGTYHEAGVYTTISGAKGFASDYETSTTFDVSKHTTLQKKNVSRSRYFNAEVAEASVDAKYSVSGTVNGYSFSFNVIANAF